MTHQAPNPGDPNYSWEDPHGFHHDAAGDEHHEHHVSPWQLLLGILLCLMFFTWFTVFTADIESFLALNFGVHVSQLTNVMIAMSIATIKAYLVCAYFMHLKHDTPLNNWVLVFTFLTFGIFLLFPALEVANRPVLNAFRDDEKVVGGTGYGMAHYTGETFTNISKVDWLRRKKLEELVEENGVEEGEWSYWSHFYDWEYHYHYEAHRYVRPDLEGDEASLDLWDSKNYFARWEKEHADGHGDHGHDDHGHSGDDAGDHDHEGDHEDSHGSDHEAGQDHDDESHADGEHE